MINDSIIGDIIIRELNFIPKAIVQKQTGICNHVFEVIGKRRNFIIRLNDYGDYMKGTSKFLPIFKKLQINTPEIIAENYERKYFNYCYQILTKIPGDDLENIINTLKEVELIKIAKDVAVIIQKFRSLLCNNYFGALTGTHEETFPNLKEVFLKQLSTIAKRQHVNNTVPFASMDIYSELIHRNSLYLESVRPVLYFDDMASKNVMINNNKFSGLVDLDFLRRGDILELLGKKIACWSGSQNGQFYTNTLIAYEKLTIEEIRISKMYAIFNLINWISEEGFDYKNKEQKIDWNHITFLNNRAIALFKEIDI